MVKNPKPDPEVFINASSGLGLPRSECLVFEDAESGVIAAKKGGFHVIGVGNLKIKESCDYSIKNIGEWVKFKYHKIPNRLSFYYLFMLLNNTVHNKSIEELFDINNT